MFSELAMTVLVALVGLHVVAASPFSAAAPTCPEPNTKDPLKHVISTRPICCTAEQTPDPGSYTCTPYKDNVACPSDKPVIRCCYGADPVHPTYHCSPPN